jgi:hypothetical protein
VIGMIRGPSRTSCALYSNDGADGTKNALLQNSGFAIALRFLVASLARQRKTNKAASVTREKLAIEPGRTLTELRARSLFPERLVSKPLLRGIEGSGIAGR